MRSEGNLAIEMRRNLQKIYLLLWKNYIVQKRHPIRTVIEFTLPLVITFVLVILRNWVKPVKTPTPTTYSFFKLDVCDNITQSKKWDLAWSPTTDDVAKEIMTKIMASGRYQNHHGFLNADEMDHHLFNLHIRDKVLAGISFDESVLPNKSFSSHAKVTLRFPGLSRLPLPNTIALDTQIPNWRTHLVFPLYQPFGPRDSLFATGGEPGYCEEGFLELQKDIFTAILNHYNKTPQVPEFVITRFPYPAYTADGLLPALISFISIFLLISFVFTAINTIKLVTAEKESQMKEAMKLMGIPNWMHWMAWYIKELVQWLIPIIMITFLLTHKWSQGYIIEKSDPYLIFFVLVLYAVASIAFCFLVSVCFNRANSAATIGGALWFLQYSPYLILQPKYVNMTWGQVMMCSLLSNTNMGYLWQIIVTYEGREGLHWKNMFEPVSPSDKVSVIDLISMLVVDSVIYMLLAIYIEGVFPGKYGVSMPWYFPFQPTYWLGYKKDMRDVRPIKGIQIKNLTKMFDNKTVAVHNLNLDLYPNQITVLLGHNGAGKSTTMSILTGLIRPTSGTAIINGYDIWSDMDRIRDDLGLCPQYNLLFAELTIKEHLQFFGTLKESGKEDLEIQIQKYMKQLELESKLNDQAHTLSGGYKRRLSVAIALAGKSKVVLLDEPTSGMDPSARRCLWDLLQAERNGRTVVMTTHLMDEADVLGDRVAIMKSGELKCIGTPFTLKKEYGRGYTLSLVKSKTDFRDEKITMFLQSFYSDVYPTCNTETEVKYCIEDPKHFPDLLSALAKEQASLGIKAYGVSLTTMEDVYMSVAISKKLPDVTAENNTSNKISISSLVPIGSVNLPSSMCQLVKVKRNKDLRETWRYQFCAMFKKKMLVSLRSWFLHFCQILITLTFLIIALIVSISWRGNTHLKPLDLSLDQYSDPVVVLANNTGDESFERINNALMKYLNKDVEVIFREPGEFKDFLLPKYTPGVYDVNQRYILGLDIKNWFVNVHFNSQPYHSLPTALNVLYNAILKDNVDSDHDISFINHPLEFLPSEMVAKFEGGSNLGFQVAFNMGFAQAFVCAIFLLITVKESETGAKHLQFISGVNPAIYWMASVLWDYMIYMLPIVTLLCTLFMYKDNAFIDCEQIVQIILLMVSFNWAFVPLTNLLSYFFHTPSLAFTAVSLLNILTGCSTVLLVLILEIRPLKLIEQSEMIDSVMIIFPHYALCSGLRYIYLSYDMAAACKGDLSTLDQECKEWKGDHYSWSRPGIGRHIFFMALVGLLGNFLLLNIEFIIARWKKLRHLIVIYCISLRSRPGIENEMKLQNNFDETDVAAEKYVAQKCLSNEYSIVMNNVWKTYGKFQAVKDVNLALKPFECFALLGSNGAGKTSTFKMLTCKSDISAGSIYICSLDVRKQKHEVSQIIGYCPQFDALINQLTGRETLKMFCTLRGIPESDHDTVVMQLSNRLILHKFLDVKIGECSGGNKRKFSTAVAMIGDPPVLLLDEPTSGMDPDARRHLWDAISEERERGKCILITTHSLEECEELCTRLAIMVDGKIRCIGSVQHLKSKYATGYKLHIKFPVNSRQNIKLAIQAYLPGSTINEEYEGMIVFHISKDVPCSKVFNVMEKAKKDSLVEDYSIQQTSLEQVFLQLTQK